MMDVMRRFRLGPALWMRRRAAEAEGQALVEYALIVSLIAIVCVGVLTVLGHNVSSIFHGMASQL